MEKTACSGGTRVRAGRTAIGAMAIGMAVSGSCEMVARIQGWSEDYPWSFTGRKTARYRQIGNAFPPPVAAAVGNAILSALRGEGEPQARSAIRSDSLYQALSARDDFVSASALLDAADELISFAELEQYIDLLARDFHIDIDERTSDKRYRLKKMKGIR